MMELIMVRSAARTEVTLFRLIDGRRHRLVVHAPYGWRDGRVFAAVALQLSDLERGEVIAALGLDSPPETA